jgi:transcriptional regulator with XRE-family HTH domain
MKDDNHTSKSDIPNERAQRLRSLRKALRYSRQKFCDKYEKYGITPGALQTWEDVRWNGLTEKGAKKLISVFKEEGLTITLEWLMYGVGENPIENITFFDRQQKKNTFSEEEKIACELKLFHELNPGAIDMVIVDDGLAPFLLPGDHVAGKRYFDKDITKAVGQICIIQTLYGNVIVRQLENGQDVGHYILKCTNTAAHVEHTTTQVKLFSAAPLLWVRKQE